MQKQKQKGMKMEYEEVKTEITKKDELLNKPMLVKAIKEVETENGKANIISATLLEENKDVNFFMAQDRSGIDNINKTYIIKTATSAKGRDYFFLQEIVVKK